LTSAAYVGIEQWTLIVNGLMTGRGAGREVVSAGFGSGLGTVAVCVEAMDKSPFAKNLPEPHLKKLSRIISPAAGGARSFLGCKELQANCLSGL
jgi:hypothetical protein